MSRALAFAFWSAATAFISGCSGGSASPGPSPTNTSRASATPTQTALATPSPSPSPTRTPSPSPSPSPTTTPSSAPESPYRLIVGQYLMRDIVADPVANALLNGTHPIVILTEENPPYSMTSPEAPAAWGASYLIRFTSEADMQAVFAAGGIPAFVDAVMYDNEPNTLPSTPPSELPPNDPAPFFSAAAALAHTNGKHFAATGGMSGTTQDTTDVIATATGWDFFAVQNQTGEADIARYDRELVDQVRAVWAINAAVAFSSGVSDVASGTLVPPTESEAAMVTVPSNGLVWMNFGPHGTIPERDDLAIDTIEQTAPLPRAAPLEP